MGGRTRTIMRAAVRTDLKDSGAVWSNTELNRCIERAVADLSRYLPRERVYETVYEPTVTNESWTSPATTALTAIVSAADINVAPPASLTIAGQPDVPRVLTLTITDADSSITSATFTITGKDKEDIACQEVFYYRKGDSKTLLGIQEFKYVYDVEVTAIAAPGAGDTLSVGYGLFTTAWVYLASKPIAEKTETVKNTAGTAQYARNTDYIMDYYKGRIKPKAGGILAAATAYLISYTRDKVGIDISSLSDFIRLQRVEYPVGQVPQSFVPSEIYDKYAIITGSGEAEAQTELHQHEQLRVYYDAAHTVPNDYTPGSIPEHLEATIEMATAAYALLTYALKQELAAETSLTSMGTALSAATTAHTALGTALTNVKKYLDNNSANDAAGALLNITALHALAAAALTNAIKYLNNNAATDAVGAIADAVTEQTAVATALTSMKKYLDNNTAADAAGVLALISHTAIATALTSAKKYLDDNTTVDAAGMLAGMTTDLSLVSDALVKLIKYLDNNSSADAAGLLAKITTDIAALRTAINTAVDAANAYADAVAATDITAAQGLIASYIGTTNYATKVTKPSILQYLDEGDAFLNTVTLGGDSETTPGMYAEYARATREIITAYENHRNAYSQEGQLRVNAAMAYVSEASQRLTNLRTYIEQSGAYVQVAVGFYQEASARVDKLNVYLQKAVQYQGISAGFISECGQRLAEIGQYNAQAQTYIAVAEGFHQEAVTRMDRANFHLQRAVQFQGIASGFLTECGQRLAEMDRYIAASQSYIAIAGGFAREAEARLGDIAQYNASASAYAEAASASLLLADRFRTEATERRNEVLSIWQDRKQLIGDFTIGSVRQLQMGQTT